MQDEQLAFARRSALQRTPPLTPNQLHLQDESSPDVTVKELPSTLRGAMEQMGACLDALSTLFNGQRHINTLMRVKLSRLTSLHKVAFDLCGKGSETANGEAQTSPSLAAGSNLAIALKNASNAAASQSNGNGVTPKRQRESASDQRKTPPKKSKNFLQNPLKRHIVNANSEHDGDPSLRAPPNGWTKVQGRQQSQKRVRADAITVTGVGDCSYADMLRMVKTDPSLKHLSGDVQGVRKTAKGDLLLRLSKKPAHSPQELQEAVGKVLGSRAVVKTLSEMSQVEIRDMDELVTKEEVLEAVKGAINDSTTTIDIIRSLRAMKDGSQIATLNMPAIKAKSLVDLGKIRIGWAVCRIKPVLQPKRCFRCQEYGHYAANCTSEEDPAQALLDQTTREQRIHVAIISEPHHQESYGTTNWVSDSSGKAAIWTCGVRQCLPPPLKAYRTDTLNTQAFTAAIQSLAITGNADTMATQMAAQLAEACDGSMARRRPYVRHHVPAYWWNERIASARQACLHARRRYTRSRGRQNFPERQLEYKTARRILKSEIRKSKRECFLELCDTAEYDPWGKAYKTVVKRINAGNQAAPTEARELKRIVETLFPSNPSILNFNAAMTSTDPIEPISTQEILAIARSLKPKKAPGPDGIPNRALRLALCLHPTVCGRHTVEDARHIMFECRRFATHRQLLEDVMGTPITIANLVPGMLEAPRKWNAVSSFAATVMRELRQAERSRRASRE
ncbi:hypothetical protein ACLKA7_012445 [Drosophila subpalustris]